MSSLNKVMNTYPAKENNKTVIREWKWDVIKVHAISHFIGDIERSGATKHYSAESYEHLHQKVSLVYGE